MLILDRKRGERVLIGEDISVMVTSIKGGRVKLGLVAPDSVTIIREELARGVPLHDIEDAFDDEENRQRRDECNE